MADDRDEILLADIPGGPAALDVTLDWIGRTIWPPLAPQHEPSRGGFSDIARSLSEALGSAGLPIWAGYLAEFAEISSEGGHRDSEAVAALLDEAGLRVAERAEHPQLFALVDDLWQMSMSSLRDPSLTLAARLPGSTENHPLMSRVAARVAEFTSLVGSLPYPLSDRIPVATRTRDLWPSPYELPIGGGWAFRVVARAWPDQFMAMLDTVPPPVAHTAIGNAGPWDSDSLLPLLAEGHPTRDDAGIVWAPPAVYALLSEIDDALGMVIQAQGIDIARQVTDRLVERLTRRVDWPWLGRAWLQELIRRGGRSRMRNRSTEADALSAGRDLLIGELAARAGPMPTAPQDWIMQEEELWRVSRALAEAAILLARGMAEEAGQLLANAVVAGQATGTGREDALRTGTPEAQIVGAVIRGLADPADWFAKLWRDTYEARERASCGLLEFYLNPAEPALVWGVVGVNSVSNSDIQARLWRLLARALVERLVTDPHTGMPMELRDTIIRAMLLLGTHFQSRGVIGTEDLAFLLIPLVEPSQRFLALVETMIAANGAPVLAACGDRIGRDTLAASLTFAIESGEAATPELAAFLQGLLAKP